MDLNKSRLVLSFVLAVIIVLGVFLLTYHDQNRNEEIRVFTWIDGKVSYSMANSVKAAYFTDVVLRRVSPADMKESVENLHSVGIVTWQWITCPGKSQNFGLYLNDAKSLYAGSGIDGYYLDDFQILAESGGNIEDYNNLVKAANEVLRDNLIICAVAGFNGKLTNDEVLTIQGIRNFDYYANIHYDYENAVFPQAESRGIYLWLLDVAQTVNLETVKHIYDEAVALRVDRITVWQWYFEGESGHRSVDSSVMFRPDLVEQISALNRNATG